MEADSHDSIGSLADLLADHVVIERVLLAENHTVVKWVTACRVFGLRSRLVLLRLEYFVLLSLGLVCRGVMHVLPLSALQLRMGALLPLIRLTATGRLLLRDKLTRRTRGWRSLARLSLLGGLLELPGTDQESLHARLLARRLGLDLRFGSFLLIVGVGCREFESMLGTERCRSCRAYIQESLACASDSRCLLFIGVLLAALRSRLGRVDLLLGHRVEIYFQFVSLRVVLSFLGQSHSPAGCLFSILIGNIDVLLGAFAA